MKIEIFTPPKFEKYPLDKDYLNKITKKVSSFFEGHYNFKCIEVLAKKYQIIIFKEI